MSGPRFPVPSLLAALQTDHLDPGYAAAAQQPRGQGRRRTWLAGGAVLVGLVLGVGAAEATSSAPDADVVRTGLAADVRQARTTQQELTQREAALSAQAEAARRTALTGNAEGRAALDQLSALSTAAGAAAVVGPGLEITLDDAEAGNGAPSRGSVLDRDLQQVVNALWASGAEAVAVGGVRLDPRSTIRQAGGAMLVNNQPVPAPYTVAAVGRPNALQTGFVVSDAYRAMSAVSRSYGTRFDVRAAESLQLPAATPVEPRFAIPQVPR
ncbi:DUF881 domain-containing protein [Rhodococcus sp. X156]|uniref:DUF881 domain-containing protein n=1 Tax=Rhodococcus sp. X156 TaxID=2499145 RepID=UPI000FDC2F40|nr:DUF881 domain-containing protein [Rhodococcus sp. X156]